MARSKDNSFGNKYKGIIERVFKNIIEYKEEKKQSNSMEKHRQENKENKND